MRVFYVELVYPRRALPLLALSVIAKALGARGLAARSRKKARLMGHIDIGGVGDYDCIGCHKELLTMQAEESAQ